MALAAAQEIDTGYIPHPKQVSLHQCPANEILYGGAAGPGKSKALREEAFIWALRIPRLHVYMFRRTYTELEDNHILPSQEEFPRELCTYKEQKHRWEFTNGSMIHFCHAHHEKDVFAHHGKEIHLLIIDELTTFTEFQYDYLRGRVRTTLDIPEKYRHKIPGIICASNPGGIGHFYVKQRWVEKCLLKATQAERYRKQRLPMYSIDTKAGPKHYGFYKAPAKEGGMLRAYIPGLLQDNPTLDIKDPGYRDRVDALPEPYRTAYKEGDWDIHFGQAFDFRQSEHVMAPVPIPAGAPLYMTFDWGYAKPFSVGWWWVDNDGRVYRFAEWYGWTRTPNQGLRMSDPDVADGIIQIEKFLEINDKRITRIAGPDCFSKRPSPWTGKGQGPSAAEIFAAKGIHLIRGDPDRVQKIRQFRARLNIPKDEEGNRIDAPMMLIYDVCEQFIRTIPVLQLDERNPEDVDTNMEDHVYDEACLICMARPMKLDFPQAKKSESDKRIEMIERGYTSTYEYLIAREHLEAMRHIEREAQWIDDQDLVDTME